MFKGIVDDARQTQDHKKKKKLPLSTLCSGELKQNQDNNTESPVAMATRRQKKKTLPLLHFKVIHLPRAHSRAMYFLCLFL